MKLFFLTLICVCLNTHALYASENCGAFSDLQTEIKAVLSNNNGSSVSYIGESGTAHVDFEKAEVTIEESKCFPTGDVCVNQEKVTLDLVCPGGKYENINIQVTRLNADQYEIVGKVGLFSKTQLLETISFNANDSLFLHNFSVAKSRSEINQVRTDIQHAHELSLGTLL